MAPFPTKILLATDGSEEATLAAQTAADIVAKIGSELHIVHVRPKIEPHYPGYYVGPEVVEHAQQKEQKKLDVEAQRLLDTQVAEVRAAGGSVAQAHLRRGKSAEEIVALAEELGAELIITGSRGRGRDKTSSYGECLLFGYLPRSLPGARDPPGRELVSAGRGPEEKWGARGMVAHPRSGGFGRDAGFQKVSLS